MHVGIFLDIGSVGLWRFAGRLIEGLVSANESLRVTIFCGERNSELISQLSLRSDRVEAVTLVSGRYSRITRVRLLQKKLEDVLGISPRMQNRRILAQCDLLVYPWPYGISMPDIDVPIVFIPHDLTYTRNFGILSRGATLGGFEWQRRMHTEWFSRATCVVSSEFTKREIGRVFGEVGSVEVIPLSRLSGVGPLAISDAKKRVEKLGVHLPFVLCANNQEAHKNLGQLLGAFALVKAKVDDLTLVLVGGDSHEVCGVCDLTTGMSFASDRTSCDVLGLGHVDDHDLIALMQLSEMVINPSLSEAGNGSGLDAWSVGAPVVMSKIPPFVEHVEFLGVCAQLFDPRCIHEIADAILFTLRERDTVRRNVEISLSAMTRWTWRDVANEYLRVFDRVCGK